MKYLKLLMITLVTVSLSTVGCSPKKGDESPTSTQNQSTSSDETKKDSLSQGEQPQAATEGEEEDALDPVAVSNAIEQIKALSPEERVRRLKLEMASIVGGLIFLGASYPLEHAAQRAALYYAVVRPAQIADVALNKREGTMALDKIAKTDLSEVTEAYYGRLKKEIAKIRAANPGMSARHAKAHINNAYGLFKEELGKKPEAIAKADAINKDTAQRLAAIEKEAAGQFAKANRSYLIRRGFGFGARGLRYVGILASGLGTAWLLYDLFDGTTTEMGDGELTIEDLMTDFERAVYNHRHDPENIEWQNKLIETCVTALSGIIEFLDIQINLSYKTIEGIKKSSMTDEEKTAGVSAKEAEIQALNEKLELQKQILAIVSSGDKPEALKTITENMDKLVGLDKEAKEQKKVSEIKPSEDKGVSAPAVSPSYPIQRMGRYPVM
ncbi:MAG: hypothetical protein HYY62_00700 [Deltaproteobacteria bacterium]|nr:hypothetical protein [Deltaproteobacteria bacterium]